MQLFLVRHTQVDMPKGICYGISNVDVAPSFEEEAALVIANVNRFEPFDAVYSSPLERCARLAKRLSDTVIIDPRLREYDFGEWEQMNWNDIYATDEGKKWFDDYVNTSCPGGESFRVMLDRVNDFLQDVTDGRKKLLIVTHAGIIRAFLILLEGYSVSKAFDTPIVYGQMIKIQTTFPQ